MSGNISASQAYLLNKMNTYANFVQLGTMLQGIESNPSIGAGNILLAMLGSGISPSHVVKYAGANQATPGGSATVTKTITGLLSTDVVVAKLDVAGAVPRTILTSAATAGTLTVVFSGDPSTDHKWSYVVLRAAV